MFWRKKCGVCGDKLGTESGVIRYRVADESEVQEMPVCKKCGDELESGAIKPEDVDE